jgi:hypothetical protein
MYFNMVSELDNNGGLTVSIDVKDLELGQILQIAESISESLSTMVEQATIKAMQQLSEEMEVN